MNKHTKLYGLIFLFLLFILFGGNVFAEKYGQARIDSLLADLPKAKDDTNKVMLLADISFTYYSINPDEGINYGNQALSLAEKLQWERGIASAHNSIGVDYSFGKSDLTNALDHYLASLKIYEKLGDKKGIAGRLNNIGTIYHDQKEYQKALDCYAKAMKINEEMGNKPWLANNLSNTGIIYTELKDFVKAEDYITRAVKIKQEMGDEQGLAINLNQLGHVYGELRDYSKALESFFPALSIYRDAMDLDGMAQSYGYISQAYMLMVSDTSIEARTNLMKHFSKNKQKALQRARMYTDSSLVLRIQTGNLKPLSNDYRQLSDLQLMQGDKEGALASYKLYTLYKDSVFDIEKDKKLTEKQMQYEFDKKTAESKAEQEKKDITQRNIRNSVSAGLAGALIFLVVVYRQRNNISKARKRSDELLLNILPVETAEELKATGTTKAKDFSEVTVMFTDFKNFTALSEKLSAQELVNEINYCFSAFDNIISKYGIEKIKTVGDSYMCAGGLPVANETNAEDTIHAALDIRDFMLNEKKAREAAGKTFFEIRIGVHSGPVVAGIVGIKKFAYDIWGNTVNIASRMESSGEAGKINISRETYELVKDKFSCEPRGKIQAKNLGEVDMFFVTRSLDEG